MVATAFHRNNMSITVSVNNFVKKAIYHTIYLNIKFVKECGLNDYLFFQIKWETCWKVLENHLSDFIN